jgi:general secretion pathway protein D
LIQDSKTVSRTQTPILGDIPLIGNVFRQKDNQIGKTELIIIIVPHLMRNGSEARRVTDEYRRELAINAPPRVRGSRTMNGNGVLASSRTTLSAAVLPCPQAETHIAE